MLHSCYMILFVEKEKPWTLWWWSAWRWPGRRSRESRQRRRSATRRRPARWRAGGVTRCLRSSGRSLRGRFGGRWSLGWWRQSSSPLQTLILEVKSYQQPCLIVLTHRTNLLVNCGVRLWFPQRPLLHCIGPASPPPLLPLRRHFPYQFKLPSIRLWIFA